MVNNKIDIVGNTAQVMAAAPRCMNRMWSCDLLEHIENVGTIVREFDRAYTLGAITDLPVFSFQIPATFRIRPTASYTDYIDELLLRKSPALSTIQHYISKMPLQVIVQWMQKFYEELPCFMLPHYKMTMYSCIFRKPTER